MTLAPIQDNPVGWSSIYPPDRMGNPDLAVSPVASRALMSDVQRLGLLGRPGPVTGADLPAVEARGQGLMDNGMAVAGAVNPVQTMGGLLGHGAMKRYPVDVVVDPLRAGTVDVLPKGRVVFYAPRKSDWPLDQSIRDTIRKQVESAVQPAGDGTFYRLTNNKQEAALAKSGQLRPSRNYAENIDEPGLSVADGPHYAGQGYKYGYRVKGDVVGKGSDGEPVLNPKTIEVLSKILPIDDLIQLHSQASVPALEKALQSRGWTMEQWRDFQRGFLSRADQ